MPRIGPLAPPAAVDTTIPIRLERGEVVYFTTCPFPLPQADDMAFLLEQRLSGGAHKNISYCPRRDRLANYRCHSRAQAERLHELIADFSRVATGWLKTAIPSYAGAWLLDQVSYRPDEEATRQLRPRARNDLLHVDAFPTRPTNGRRILRLFVNINPSEPRVWITSDNFGLLLDRYGAEAGMTPDKGHVWWDALKEGIVRLFRPGYRSRSPYDDFMLRFHHFLKANAEFQERCFKRYWTFAPGSTWLVMTDVASHAVLRGRFALEHSYFVAPEALALPEESPPALLAKACGRPVLHRAAA